MSSLTQKILIGALLVLVLVLLADKLRPADDQKVGETVVARPAKVLDKVSTTDVQTAPLKVYKPEAKKKLRLSEETQRDTKQHVLGAVKVRPDYHPHTITPVVNEETGETVIYDTKEPLPWIAIDDHGEAGAIFGLKNGSPAIRVEAKQNLLAVKAAVVSIEGSVDLPLAAPMKPDYMIGIGIHGRW